MSDHIGDSASLYALGLLDDREVADVDAHVTTCAACTHLLAQAYDDVATIAMAQPQHVRVTTRVPRSWLAVAAALVLGLLPSAYFLNQNLAMHREMDAGVEAMARISTMPHRTVAFALHNATSDSAAEVMYARDGSWYCIVVRGITRPLHVVWPHDGERTMLGTATPAKGMAMLYLPKSHRMDQLALVDGERVVASANLAF